MAWRGVAWRGPALLPGLIQSFFLAWFSPRMKVLHRPMHRCRQGEGGAGRWGGVGSGGVGGVSSACAAAIAPDVVRDSDDTTAGGVHLPLAACSALRACPRGARAREGEVVWGCARRAEKGDGCGEGRAAGAGGPEAETAATTVTAGRARGTGGRGCGSGGDEGGGGGGVALGRGRRKGASACEEERHSVHVSLSTTFFVTCRLRSPTRPAAAHPAAAAAAAFGPPTSGEGDEAGCRAKAPGGGLGTPAAARPGTLLREARARAMRQARSARQPGPWRRRMRRGACRSGCRGPP